MWAHRPWVGRWYPASVQSGTELGFYSQLCNAVEGNTTWYATPSAQAVQRWAEQTPEDFRFVLKLPRTATHERRLHDVGPIVRGFLDRVEPLGDKLGPIHIHLPPAFGPEGFEVLAAFIRRLPLDWAWALELRHPGWFDGSVSHRRLDEMLVERGIGRVILDTRPLYAAPAGSQAAVEERANKPKLAILTDVVGPNPVVRLIGEDRPEATLDGLLAWVPLIVDWARAGREPYLFVHQPDNVESPGLARQVYQALRLALPELDPLPEPAPIEGPQPSLFD